MRTPSRCRRSSSFRPRLLVLEERLPLGDGVLGLLVGAALLPTDEARFAAVTPSSGERGVSTPRWEHVTGGFTPPARQHEVFADPSAEAHDLGSVWQPLTSAFTTPARRPRGELSPSPPREQGPNAAPLLARRARDVTATVPATVTPAWHTDGDPLATLVATRQPTPAAPSNVTPAQEAQVKESFGQLPIAFEENVGQTDASVHYFARGPGYGLYLTSTEAVMALSPPQAADAVGQDSNPVDLLRQDWNPVPQAVEAPPAIVRLQVVGGNPAPAVTGRDEQPGKVNYFLGDDPAKWHTNVATFGRVEYDEVYPGIDLVWHGSQQQLEYDFVVSPGADPSQIRLHFAHADRVELDAAGDLLIHVGEPGGVSPGSTLRQHAPVVYQEEGDTRQEVASRFVLEGQQVRFAVGAYDAQLPLVIDPVLVYSTYLGGSRHDDVEGIAVDPATGDALLTGSASSTNFPTANALQPTNHGFGDVFVTRLRADGQALVYSTYLGGGGGEGGHGIAVVPTTGDVLLVGSTGSTNFPTANALQPAHRGYTDAFVTRLRADGQALVYSTYLGGTDYDFGNGIVVDPATGGALLTGETWSTNFPTANAFQPAYRGGSDAFVARLRADGQALVYSTYLGGSAWESRTGIVVDPASGDALVTGMTDSPNFPTANALQPTYGGGFSDAFVARLSANGQALVYSTYLGGSDVEYHHGGSAVDPATGDALVTGSTGSTNFPTANPLQATCGGCPGSHDAFVARVSASGSALVFSTYLGGSNHESGQDLATDPATGDALLTGQTTSTDFPTTHPLQSTNCAGDAFVARLRVDGQALVYASCLGGSGSDFGRDIAVDGAGSVFVTGETSSLDFPTVNAFQPGHGGGLCDFPVRPCRDAFVSRIGSSPVAYYYVYPDSGQVTAGAPFDLYVFALDAQFHVIPDYTGLILFYATDPLATTPVYYQYQRTDRGIAAFPNGLTFRTPGMQELYVFDWPGVQVFGYAAYQVI